MTASPPKKFRVALVYALLFMIAYGALVETVHSHGSVRPIQYNVASVTDASNSQSTADGFSHQRDCSICQFQRQLFDGFLHTTLLIRSAQTEIVATSSIIASYSLISATPRLGRAPPFAS